MNTTPPENSRIRTVLFDLDGTLLGSDGTLAQKDIDGGLIGGAALESRGFVDLVKAAAAA